MLAHKKALLDEDLGFWEGVLGCQPACILVAEEEQFYSRVLVDVIEVKNVCFCLSGVTSLFAHEANQQVLNFNRATLKRMLSVKE